MATATGTRDEILAPPSPPGPLGWLHENLFSGWFNTLLTLVSGVILYFLVSGALRWVFFSANWKPVTQSPLLYAVGQYPRTHLWRIGLSLSFVMFALGLSWGKWGGLLRSISVVVGGAFALVALLPVSHPQLSLGMRIYLGSNPLVILLGYLLGLQATLKRGVIIGFWLFLPIVVTAIIRGFNTNELFSWLLVAGILDLALLLSGFLWNIRALKIGALIAALVIAPALVILTFVGALEVLAPVTTTLWGGLLVTLVLAVGGITLSFPIGVALALGRRSSLPVVSAFSTAFIETIRGVPLVTILFMFSVILTLFLPPDARVDRLVRALMAMTVFSAAYAAENVRGGLQSVPEGQLEAARAVGMNSFQMTAFIVLPQAIRAVIPAIVGQFIALFKDTTLVTIVGINDLLGIGKSVINSTPEFVRLQTEVYLFIAVIFMIFSYLMSLASRRLEAALGVGER